MIINQGWKSKFFLRFPSLWDLDFCGLAPRCGWAWPIRGRTGDQRTNQRPGETEAPDSLLGLLSVNLRVLGPVSARLRTRTDEAALIVPVICQKGENSWLFSFLTFLSSVDEKFISMLENIILYKYFRWMNIFSSAAFQTRENYLFYNEAGSQATLHRCRIFFQLGIRVW